DSMLLRLLHLSLSTDQVPDVETRGVETPLKCRHGTGSRRNQADDVLVDVLLQVFERLTTSGIVIVDEPRLYARNHRGQLTGRVIRLRKKKSEIAFAAEFLNRPTVSGHTFLTTPRVRKQYLLLLLHRRVDRQTRKTSRLEPQLPISGLGFVLT